MKHLILTFVSLIMSHAAMADLTAEAASHRISGYPNSLIFVENGITFSVYPDGEYDFFIDNPDYIGAAYRGNQVSISFNAGFNYDPWVQYDDYGAVIQVENTPIYYDFYGRVSRIGSVNIFYQRGKISRIGGLYVYYDGFGRFNRFNGYINMYNRHFTFMPVYHYFVRPSVGFCLVNTRPYRRYYHPVRYTYYRPYRNNHRRAYATVGRPYHYKDGNPRSNVYRNDRRVTGRNDQSVRNDIRKRSLQYENNKRGYNKNANVKSPDRRGNAYGDQRNAKVTKVRNERPATNADREYNSPRPQSSRATTARASRTVQSPNTEGRNARAKSSVRMKSSPNGRVTSKASGRSRSNTAKTYERRNTSKGNSSVSGRSTVRTKTTGNTTRGRRNQ